MEIQFNNKKYNKIKELLADTTVANIDKFLVDNKKITLKDFIVMQEEENKEDAKGSVSNSAGMGSSFNSGYGGSSFNSGYRGSSFNSGYRGSASNSGYMGSSSNSGDDGSSSNSGDWGSASNSGEWSSASNSGEWGSASNSGYGGSAFNSGYMGSASNSGYMGSASNSGNWGSASNSGYMGSASNSGNWGTATSNAFYSTVCNKAGLHAMITEFVIKYNPTGIDQLKSCICKQNVKLVKFTKKTEGKHFTLLKGKLFEVIICDDIRMAVIEQRELSGYKILTGISYGNDFFKDIFIYNKNTKLADIPTMVVVEKDGVYSHGDTVEQAIKDFRYKISNRERKRLIEQLNEE